MTDYLESNRELWNEWADVNARSGFYRLDEFRRGGIRLRDYELEEIGEVAGKDLLHLQCHFGLDTLSFARLGANVTGADFSERAIEIATRLADELELPARFVLSDLYELPRNLDGSFDIVYTSRGVIGWLPDLERWAGVIAHFLRPGGVFYVTEVHPVVWVFDDENVGPGELRPRFQYWTAPEPLAFPVQGSYADRQADVRTEVEYGWNHSLGEIVSAVAGAGLRIDFLHEHPFVEWPVEFLEEREDGTWRLPGALDGTLPLFFSLRATKA